LDVCKIYNFILYLIQYKNSLKKRKKLKRALGEIRRINDP
jgi:hypothetical protein